MKFSTTTSRWIPILGLFVAFHLPITAEAATCPALKDIRRAESGTTRTSIVELYTSEGCNSCPPADKWFSTLNKLGNQQQPFIPLAFHVDYWDYIGWNDRFAQPKFAVQQRTRVQVAGKRTVYTPQVFVDGADVGLWSSGRVMANAATVIRANPATVQLNLDVTRRTVSDFQVAAQVVAGSNTSQPLNGLVVYVAVVEQNLSSSVKAGENKNVLLEHAHTVRQLIGPLSIVTGQTSGNAGRERSAGATTSLTLDPTWKLEDLSVVAYAQRRSSNSTLQAVGLNLCESNRVAAAGAMR